MNTEKLPIIKLTGLPFERGRDYGSKEAKRIAGVLSLWFRNLGGFSGTHQSVADNYQSYLDEFFSSTKYIEAIKRWAPALLDEVQGIAEGAGQPWKHILGLQLMDEEWVFGMSKSLIRPTSKCTAFGLVQQKKGITYAGQNMDVPAWVEGNQLLLRIEASQSSPEILVFTLAGNIGLNGLNACGLGISCNTLAQLKPSIDGLPVAFIVRSVLSKSTIDEAEAFLREIKHASGQNYILSSKDDIRCFECSGNQVKAIPIDPLSGGVFHTNHPLISDNFGSASELCQPRQYNSEARLQSISNRLGAGSNALRDIKNALAAHDDRDNPVSRVITPSNQDTSIGYTAAACIYEFGEQPRFHLASGPPCQTSFKVFEYQQYSYAS